MRMRLATFTVLLLALLSGTGFGESTGPLVLPNADFERVQNLGTGEYACRFPDWLYKVRSGSYEHGPAAGEDGSTAARIACVDGKAGRADLLGPLLELPPFTEFQVSVRVRQEGATALVALHPTYRRRQTDVALAFAGSSERRLFEATLQTGAKSERYRFTLGVVGDGWVEFDDLRVVQGETVGPAKGTVVILDMNPRAKDYEEPDPFWLEDEIRTIWGYDVEVVRHIQFDAKALARMRPRCVVVMPAASYETPAGDRQARARGQRKVFAWLQKTRVPVLGICLGHQVLGRAAGGRMQREGERGDVLLVREGRGDDDPIFDGLESSVPISQSHRYALIETPKGFDLLATSETCRVQVIRRRGRLHYGFQGHFERGWANTTPHGRVLLGNFFRQVESAH